MPESGSSMHGCPNRVRRCVVAVLPNDTGQLLASQLDSAGDVLRPVAAWYDKSSPTFMDAIALVSRHLWLA